MTNTLIGLSCTNPHIRDERVEAIFEYLRNNKHISQIILSGGAIQSEKPEAEIMKEKLTGLAGDILSRAKIILESKSNNSVESIENIRTILDGLGTNVATIISSKSHLWGIRKEIPSGFEHVSSEEILGLKMDIRRAVYWAYELARPLGKNPVTRKILSPVKGIINKG
ncbi:YdcF family protein [Candidatus Gracilibacteria bacterium]|nr:YdcF family protein [Candidatus Gracilibacteria bacterium]